jgi:hypothetical protein
MTRRDVHTFKDVGTRRRWDAAISNERPRPRLRLVADRTGSEHAMASEVRRLTRALAFAAEAHRNHRRKGASQEPYINHLIEVLDLVASVEDDDIDVLVAALLHDVLEDTQTAYDELVAVFGERVAQIVHENSDDMTLPKPDRGRARLAAMRKKSREARLVKFADIISNLRATAVSPPAGWSNDRRLGYLNSCRNLADAGRGSNAEIERIFDDTARAVEQTIRAEDLGHSDSASARRELEAAIGQSVHLVYVPNTRFRPLGDGDIDLLCRTIARTFPSATVQMAEDVYESRRRSILIVRIRTDSSDAVVDLAQRLCITFDEPFVGIEIDGRYIRIYGDDTA